MAAQTAGSLATTGIVWLIDALGWGWLAGKAAAVLATTIWNYFAYLHWVFAGTRVGDVDV